MRLQDEYLARHNLTYAPVYHSVDTNLILEINNRPRILFNIKWQEIDRRPGYYEISYTKINHNGYLDGQYFIKLETEHTLQYSDYLGFIKLWASNLNSRVVKKEDVFIAIWEMFIFCFDGWILKNNLEELIFQTIDPMLNMDQRISNIKHFIRYLSENKPTIYEIYSSEFQKIELNYADWLTNLIRS